MKKILISSFLLLCLICSTAKVQAATVWVNVPNADDLLWQMTENGTVYFRNLNQFNSAHGGCCYSYYLNTTTEGGKALWTLLLTRMAQGKSVSLGVPGIGSASNKQPVIYVGKHSH